MNNTFISVKGFIFSLPYILLAFIIPSIDYEARLGFLDAGLNLFQLVTREPIFLIELYILEILFGDNSVFIARILNIYISIILILILSNIDKLSDYKKILLIYNPISFFLIFNINAQLLATLSIYWVIRGHKKSGYFAVLAPLFHLLGLLAVFIFFLKKSLISIPLFSITIFLILIFAHDYFLDLYYFIYQFNDFFVNKFLAYNTYQTNLMHALLTFMLIFVSFTILIYKRRISSRYLFLCIFVFLLSFMSLDYKFFSRLIFSFEFLLIYEVISFTNIKYHSKFKYEQ